MGSAGERLGKFTLFPRVTSQPWELPQTVPRLPRHQTLITHTQSPHFCPSAACAALCHAPPFAMRRSLPHAALRHTPPLVTRRASPRAAPRHAPRFATRRPLSCRPFATRRPSSRAAPRHAPRFATRRPSSRRPFAARQPSSRHPFAARRPSSRVASAATQVRFLLFFSLVPIDVLPPLQVQRTPFSLANRERGLSPFFS